MKTKVHLKSILTAIVMAFGITVWAQPGASIAEAIEVNDFPHTESINTITNGVYITTLGGTSCNSLACCLALVYKVTIPEYGSLRIENLDYQLNSGSIIAYTPKVETPSEWSDLEYWNKIGNNCGFKDTMLLGTYCSWQDGVSEPVWVNTINDAPIDENNPQHVVPPGIYYIIIMNYNQYTSTGGTAGNFIFSFSPYVFCTNTAGTDVQTACDSYTWIDDKIYTESNSTATHTLTNAAGCDSIVTLNLTINNSTSGSETISECDSYTWTANGETYTTSGTYTATLTNATGCDSTATLNLTIKEASTGTDVQTACDSYTWIDDKIYTESNSTATHTLTNTEGCDSVVTLNLTINNSTSGSETISECDSYTWQANSQTYTESGTHTVTLVNSVGCDSVATLELTILKSSSSEIDIEETGDNYTAPDGTSYNEVGTYVAVIENSVGCDSTVTINLTFNEATNIFNDKEMVKAIIYPNPTSEKVNIRLKEVDDYKIQVYSNTGNLIFNDNYTDTQEISFSLKASPGIYNVVISSDNHEFKSKIMIVEK
ncbi:MAG: T9SS type A sorting domain-containing protein [Bacteroidales bacterium]|nr:T9SS type A sorting domain-containing protein [Bacteroidales bacterium]